MRVEELKLRNFRNYENVNLHFHSHTNILLGMNAQGKTNLLEALFFLSTTHSHRMSLDAQMIKEGKDCATVDCLMDDDGIKKRVGAVLYTKGKTLLLNGQPTKRASDFVGKINVVLFSPQDLELFSHSPRERRKMLDLEIGKLDSSYMRNLSQYLKCLKERNALLKSNRSSEETLQILEKQMATLQSNLVQKRKQILDQLNQTLSQNYEKLSKEKHDLLLKYDSSVEKEGKELQESDYLKMYERTRERDTILKSTNSGIHRDDFSCVFDGKNIEYVASQGQKRMTILALKMGLVQYILEKTRKVPIFLLDDVLSELDSEKQKNLLSTLPKDMQIMITTTDLRECKEVLDQDTKIMKIEHGQVMESKEAVA